MDSFELGFVSGMEKTANAGTVPGGIIGGLASGVLGAGIGALADDDDHWRGARNGAIAGGIMGTIGGAMRGHAQTEALKKTLANSHRPFASHNFANERLMDTTGFMLGFPGGMAASGIYANRRSQLAKRKENK